MFICTPSTRGGVGCIIKFEGNTFGTSFEVGRDFVARNILNIKVVYIPRLPFFSFSERACVNASFDSSPRCCRLHEFRDNELLYDSRKSLICNHRGA